MLRKQSEMKLGVLGNCHDGRGNVHCRTVLARGDSELDIRFMHDDTIEPAASIGEHRHDDNEEVYFVVEGQGTMILDGRPSPIGPGDVSVVHRGHSHGLINSPDGPMRLIVFCVGQNKLA